MFWHFQLERRELIFRMNLVYLEFDEKLHIEGISEMLSKKTVTIVLTGPESAGKTALGLELSKALTSPFISEYAREFLVDLDRPYKIQDLIHISETQNKRVREMQNGENRYLVVDTFMVWSKVKFGQIPDRIKEIHHTTSIDLYILCKPDIPWEEDPLREHPNQRERLFEIQLVALEGSGANFIVVSGDLKKRTEKVLDFLGSSEEKG